MIMKKQWFIFSGGIIAGILLTFLAAFMFNLSSKNDSIQSDNGITWFEKPGDVIEVRAFEVSQVVYDNAALVRGASLRTNDHDDLFGVTYLLTNEDGKYYYDDEIIEVPVGKEVRQVGIYHYQTVGGLSRTVPIIQIMDK